MPMHKDREVMFSQFPPKTTVSRTLDLQKAGVITKKIARPLATGYRRGKFNKHAPAQRDRHAADDE